MKRRLEQLTASLAARAGEHDRAGRWPADVMQAFAEFGCWRWAVPREFGGDEWGSVELIEGFEAIARGSMAAILIFTQHDAGTDLIVRGENGELRERLCPKIAAGELLLTVGISQITTSQQGGAPAMKVEWDGATAVFDGFMPWVTSATEADLMVTAGVLPDGRQLLAVMPCDTPGLSVEPPMELAAMTATCTARVLCRDAKLDAACVIRGPAEKVLTLRAPVRPLVVSSAGIGLAGAMLDEIERMSPHRSGELRAFGDELRAQYDSVRGRLYDAADMLSDPTAEAPAGEIRAAVNDLVMRLAIVTVTFAKGTGYLADRPAQRLAREAMFFLVWSIPESVQVDTLRRILG